MAFEAKQLTVRPDMGPPKGPNYNELERIETLKAELERRMRLFGGKPEYVSVPRDTLEELVQIMADGIRTAKQVMEQNK